MATTNPQAEAIAQFIVLEFCSNKRMNFATVAHLIASGALDEGVSLDDIVDIFLSRLDENDIKRLFDGVVAGKVQFDVITITLEPSNIATFIDDRTSLIDKSEIVKSAFWWTCRAHLHLSV